MTGSTSTSTLPQLIQGGMGIGVSGWRLARAVGRHDQMGVVSGTALEMLMSRRLQQGDPDGSTREALAAFPLPDVTSRIMERYFLANGKPTHVPYKPVPLFSQRPSPALLDLTVAAGFVEVYLAKQGHSGPIGINLLEKIQMPTLATLYGAMLARVDYVLMGAGIPKSIPRILDQFSEGEKSSLILQVAGALPGEKFEMIFDPKTYFPDGAPTLHRPRFLAIVSSDILASSLAKKAEGYIDGFIVEGHTAGGHNAPPRGAQQLNSEGEPLYGLRDEPRWEAYQAIGRPFWIAGGYSSHERLQEALEVGAVGIQVGTAFAYCNESGIRNDLKLRVIQSVLRSSVKIFTDPKASPSGFPFKMVRLEGTVGDPLITRERGCDMGYLRQTYRKADGTLGSRCSGEPEADYLRKGGILEETLGRKCICNGLMSGIGFAQIDSEGKEEPPLLTAGNALSEISRFIQPGATSYSAHEVIRKILSQKDLIALGTSSNATSASIT